MSLTLYATAKMELYFILLVQRFGPRNASSPDDVIQRNTEPLNFKEVTLLDQIETFQTPAKTLFSLLRVPL